MDRIKGKLHKLLICFGEILVGVLLLLDPVNFTAGIITVLGVVMIVLGIMSAVQYIWTDPLAASQHSGLSAGVLMILAGLFCAFRAHWFIVTFPLLTVLYGILILILGAVKLQWTVDMIRLKQGRWMLGAISTAISFLFAAVILVNPFGSTAFLWTFVAVSMIVGAVLDFLSAVFGHKKDGQAKPETQE